MNLWLTRVVARPALLAGLVLGGCGSPDPVGSRPTVTDSAGITTVTHHSIDDSLDPADAERTVLGAGTAAAEAFYRVRAGVLLGDSGAVVANAGTGELLFFGADGALRTSFGREGQGPEEFSNLFQLQGMPDGSVVASDPGNRRLSWIDAGGRLLVSRTITFEPEDVDLTRAIVGPGYTFGVTTAGDVVTVPWARATYSGSEGALPLKGELRRYVPDLSDHVVLDSVLLRTWFEQPRSNGPPIGNVLGSPVLVHSANREWIAYSEGTHHRIDVLEEGARAYVIEESRGRTPFEPDSVPAGYHHAVDSLPSYSDLIVDSDGRIWVRGGTPDASPTAEWRVFSERGSRAQRVTLPASSRVLDASAGDLLVLERSDLDVERVVLYSLVAADLPR
ncbi:MAG: hypothetical protein RJQ04_13765 [Longimicrobiales bacterium]